MGTDAEHSRKVNLVSGRGSSRSHHIGLVGGSVHRPHYNQLVAIEIGDIHRNSRSCSARRGTIQSDRARTTDAGSVVTGLVRADVNDSAHDPREASLVGGRGIGVVAGVDGRAAAKEGVGKGGPAVVLQRPQLERSGVDVELIAGSGVDNTGGSRG